MAVLWRVGWQELRRWRRGGPHWLFHPDAIVGLWGPMERVEQVRFHMDADTLYDGFVTQAGRVIGHVQDWGSEGCLFLPTATNCEDEHPRPLEADTMVELYEMVCAEVSLMNMPE